MSKILPRPEYLVFIGRFQPFHNGHLEVIKHALSISNKVVVLIGSAQVARDERNTFTEVEREQFISATMSDLGLRDRVFIGSVKDYLYREDSWLSDVQREVARLTGNSKSVGIIGHQRDETSYYLKKFPQWGEPIEVGELASGISGTAIREAFFSGNILDKYLPSAVCRFMQDYFTTPAYTELVREYEYNVAYRREWSNTRYPVTFTTVDSVVKKHGNVLLVERGGYPGKGLLALPGGFLEPDERLAESALRELREETRLKVPLPVLEHAMSTRPSKVFDHPRRSLRGRTITHGFLFDLDEADTAPGLPDVRGGDDAKHAFWIPTSLIPSLRNKFFEDHYHIINYFIGFGD